MAQAADQAADQALAGSGCAAHARQCLADHRPMARSPHRAAGCACAHPCRPNPLTPPHRQAQQPLAIALAGLLSLAVAMGIGRFAFTPLLPMMLHDGVIALPAASWLATASYLGYWLGAVACALQPALWARWQPGRPLAHTSAVRVGPVATLVLTAAMALPWPTLWQLWPLWRLMAGLGIAVSGLAATAMVAGGSHAATAWGAFAVLAAVLTVPA